MMIRLSKISAILLGGALILGLTGCSSESNVASNSTGNSAGTSAATSATSSTVSTKIDPEQPDRVAEVYGKVKSIQGNVVLISEMQRQQTGAELSEADKAKRREQMQSLSEEERQKLQASQEVVTGKTLTLTVPVGIPVKVKTTGSNGATVEDGTIASIKTGSILNIWTEKSDQNTAEYVSISNR